MYSPRMVGIGSLEAILNSSEILNVGDTYTFTFNINKILITTSDIDVQNKLQYFMQNYGDVISVVRPLFSGRYVVTVVSKANYPLSAWVNAFDYSWRNMPGLEQTSFLTAEGGVVSTVPGGVPGLVRGAGEQLKLTLPDLSGLAPYLLWGGLAILAVTVVLPALVRRN